MKAGASILVCLAMGALAGAVVAGRSSAGATVEPAAATPIVAEPRFDWSAAREPVKPAIPSVPLISIPKLQLKARIGSDVDRGPAWWPVTGRPGRGDIVAIAGHRTTHTRPFYWLDRLEPGDAIYVRFAGRMHAYRVSGRRILSAKDLHIADARGHEVLLLSACTPRGSSRQRIVVYAWPQI